MPFDFCFRNLCIRQIAPESPVIRKLEFRRGDHSRAEAHRLVLAETHVLNVSQRSHAQLLLFDRFV